MNYETTGEIEEAVVRHFNARKNVIVPNVSWGMFPYELDLCMLNLAGMYASEIEIKISKSDLKADGKKHHCHDKNGNFIKYLWFAMPDKLKGCEDLVPENAGILYINKYGYGKIFRKPVVNPVARKWDYEKAFKLARLGTLRIWSLKRKTRELQERIKGLIKKLSETKIKGEK